MRGLSVLLEAKIGNSRD